MDKMNKEHTMQQIEQPLIDQETGEILDQHEHGWTTEHLPAIGRQIAALQRRIANIEVYQIGEVRRINEICQAKIDKLQSQVDFFLAVAAPHCTDKTTEYPGIGVFRFRKLPARVDDSHWQAMTDEERERVIADHPDIFEVRRTVHPKKAEIKKVLEDSEVPGWSIVHQPEKFSFRGEA